MKYLLDSDILTAMEDTDSDRHKKVVRRISALSDDDEVCLSLITMYEYSFGIANAPDKTLAESLSRAKSTLLQLFHVLPLSLVGADVYGKLKAGYRGHTGCSRQDLRRHNVDMILASTAMEHGAVLVSADQIFAKIREYAPDLRVENWLQPE